jgi:hypothetical protein
MLQPFDIEVEYEVGESMRDFNVAVVLDNESGETVFHTTHHLSEDDLTSIEPGRHVSVASVPAGALNSGRYWITVGAQIIYGRQIWEAQHAFGFEVELTCPRMARYNVGAYKGPVGPRLASWARRELSAVAGG